MRFRTQMSGIPAVIGMPFDLQESEWGNLMLPLKRRLISFHLPERYFPIQRCGCRNGVGSAGKKASGDWRAKPAGRWPVLYTPCR